VIKRAVFLSLLLFCSLIVDGQLVNWQWALPAASNGDETALDITRDPVNGQILIGGYYNNNLALTFGPGFLSPGFRDGYVARISQAGVVLSAFGIGGSGADEVKSIATDASGNIYVTGFFSATADFDPLILATYSITSSGNRDGFLAKYTSSGSLLWAVKFGGTGNDEAMKVTVEGSGVFITGCYESSATFLSTNTVSANTGTTLSGVTFFGAKYSTSGVIEWVVKGGAAGNDIGTTLCADASRVYFAGTYLNTSTVYDASATPVATLSAQSGTTTDIFLLAFDHSGSLQWATNACSGNDDVVLSLTQDASRIYVGGGFRGTMSMPYPSSTFTMSNAGGNDVLVASATKSTGVFDWVWTQSGSGAGDEQANALARDANGNLVISGIFNGTVNYAAAGGPQIISSGGNDIFVTTLNSSGGFLWTAKAGGASADAPMGVIAPAPGTVYVAGEYVNTALFGAISLVNFNGQNVFVARTGCEPLTNNTISATQTICAATAPATLTGSIPSGGSSGFTYLWQQSANNLTWTTAAGSSTLINYAPPTANSTMYYRRMVNHSGGCTEPGNTVTITAVAIPGPTAAVTGFSVCSSSSSLSVPAATAGVGSWSVVSGTGIFSSSVTPNTSVSGISAGENVFSWVVANAPCPNAVTTVSVQRDLPPSTAGTAPSQTICSASVTLSATAPTAGVGSWAVVSGPSSLSSTTALNPLATNLSVGLNLFSWTVVNGVCPPSSATVAVHRDDFPTSSNAGADATVCATSFTLSGNVPAAGIGTWSVITGGSTLQSTASATTVASAISAGVNSFIWTISNGVCPPSSSTINVTRHQNPSTALAGNSQTVCSASATLTAATPSIGTGAWSVVTGGSSLASSASATTTVNSLSTGTNQFVWTVSNGVCPTSTAAVSIVRDALPTTASAGANATICSTAFTLNGNVPAVGTGNWSLISGSGTIQSPSTFSTAVGSLNVGLNKFAWTIANGICPSSSSTVIVTRDENPSPAVTGNNQTVCATSATLAATVPSTGIGSWSAASGNPSITSVSSSTTTASNLAPGVNQFIWTVNNGVCPPSTSTLTVTRDQQPSVALAGNSQTVCSASATLSASTPSVGSGMWSVLSGGSSLSTATSATTGVTSLDTGTNQFLWTVSNGVCPSSTAMVIVQRDASPAPANAGSNVTVCATTVTLSGNVPSIGTGSWTLISGGGNIQASASATTAVNSLSVGLNRFTWTIVNGVCPALSSTVDVNRDAVPSAASAGSNATVCATTVTLSAGTPVTGTGSWSVVTGGASLSSTSVIQPTVTNLSAGINIFMWTVSNGVCMPSTSTVSVQRDLLPDLSNAGPNQTVCVTSATLAGNVPSTGTGAWSLISGAGTIVSPGQAGSAVTTIATGTNVFAWTISNGVCAASQSTVGIIRDANPSAADAGLNQTVCAPGATISAVPPAIGIGSWSVVGGGSTLSSPASPTSAVNNLGTGTNVFIWTVVNGVCPPSAAAVAVQRDAQPSPALTGANHTICATVSTLTANQPAVGIGSWSVISSSGFIASPVSATTQVSSLTPGTHAFAWIIAHGVCPTSSAQLVVTVDPYPDQSNAGADIQLCGTSTVLAGNSPSVGTGAWSALSGAVIDTPNQHTTMVSGLPTGTNQFVWTITNGTCPASIDTVNVVSFEAPGPATAGSDTSVCAETGVLTAASVYTGTGKWKTTSLATILNDNSSQSTVSGLTGGKNMFVWEISNGICPVATDTLFIWRDLPPSAAVAGPDTAVCGKTVVVNAAQPVSGTGQWTSFGTGMEVQNPQSVQTSVKFLSQGNHLLAWSVTNGVCPPSTDSLNIDVFYDPGVAHAGENLSICGSAASLNAGALLAGIGEWQLISGSGSISDPQSPSALISEIKSPEVILKWTVTNGVCPQTSDELTVRRDSASAEAIAGADIETESNRINLDATAFPNSTGNWQLVDGAGTVVQPADPKTSVIDLAPGTNIFRWVVKTGDCPASSDEVTVHVKPFSVPNAMSPNNDGKNDVFHITGLENYTSVKLTVFNRWGAVVFADDDYQNNWAGTNQDGARLSDDTYYYILEITGLKNYTGFILIKTQR
jgi:gliding motility-associated-like protein